MTPTHDTSPELHERFLLGDLTTEEHDRLEHRLLEDPDLFEQVEAAEDELVDRYSRREMSAADRRRFEERLLGSRRIRDRVLTARSLRRAAEKAEPAEAPTNGQLVPLTSRNGHRRHPASQPTQWLAWAACLVSLVAAGVLALTSLHLQDRLDRVQQAHENVVDQALSAEERVDELSTTVERARATRSELEKLRGRLTEKDDRIAALQERIASLAEPATSSTPGGEERVSGTHRVEPTVVFLTLATRAAGEQEPLELPLAGGEVELQLDLDRLRPEAPLTVTLSRSDVTVWRRSGVEPVHYGPDTMASVNVPAETLVPGSYIIEVTEQTAGGVETHGRYTLTVQG